MIKGIIFDFDGVILESVGVKTEAFRRLFADYPDKIEEIITYHMDQGGISRYRKFEYIYAHILKEDLTPERSNELGALFSEYAYQQVVRAPFVSGAEDFLKKYYQQLNLFVATGTPQEEIDSVITERKLTKYFRNVYGSPMTKDVIVRSVLNESGLTPKEVIFVGDAITDFNGAKKAGVPFVGRIHPDYENPFKELSVAGLIKNLYELETLLLKEYITK